MTRGRGHSRQIRRVLGGRLRGPVHASAAASAGCRSRRGRGGASAAHDNHLDTCVFISGLRFQCRGRLGVGCCRECSLSRWHDTERGLQGKRSSWASGERATDGSAQRGFRFRFPQAVPLLRTEVPNQERNREPEPGTLRVPNTGTVRVPPHGSAKTEPRFHAELSVLCGRFRTAKFSAQKKLRFFQPVLGPADGVPIDAGASERDGGRGALLAR